jgi:hypothetical protein
MDYIANKNLYKRRISDLKKYLSFSQALECMKEGEDIRLMEWDKTHFLRIEFEDETARVIIVEVENNVAGLWHPYQKALLSNEWVVNR